MLNRIAADNLVPDLTFIFDIPVAERLQRLGTRDLDRLEREEYNFQEKIRQGFLKIAAAEPNRVCLIDGTKAEELVADEVWHKFNKIIRKMQI